MKKFTKISLIIAVAMMMAGGIFFGVGAVMAGGTSALNEAIRNEEFDFLEYGIDIDEETVKNLVEDVQEVLPGGKEGVTHEFTEEIKKLDMQMDLADVIIRVSDTEKLTVTLEDGYLKYYNIEAADDTVSVTYDVGVNNFRQGPKITVEIPEQMLLEHIYVDTELGEIRVANLEQSLPEMELRTSMGNIETENCKVNGMCTMYAAMGNIEAEDCFFEKIDLSAAMGNIDFNGTVSESITAQANMGDVEVELDGKETDYNIELSTDMGNVTFEGEKQKGNMGGSYTYYPETAEAEICLISNMGNVELRFDK